MRLSYATLGAFIKYPKASLPHQPSPHVAHKKYGFFQAQKPFFDILSKELGLADSNSIDRHPLAYLVEAADDICYTIIDFEDGIHLGWIDEEYALEYLINLVKEDMDTLKYSKLKHRTQRLGYLRALAINSQSKTQSEFLPKMKPIFSMEVSAVPYWKKVNIKRKLRILSI